jgi:hypothetical protein
MFIPDEPFPTAPEAAGAVEPAAAFSPAPEDDDVFTVVDDDAAVVAPEPEPVESAYGGETPADLLESASMAVEDTVSQSWGETAEVSWEARANAVADRGDRAVFEEVFEAEVPQGQAAPPAISPDIEGQYPEFEAEPDLVSPARQETPADKGSEETAAEQEFEPQFEPVYEPEVAEVESLGESVPAQESPRSQPGRSVNMPTLVPQMLPGHMAGSAEPEFEMEGLGDIGRGAEVEEEPAPAPAAASFADVVTREPQEEPKVEVSEAAEVGVPKDMVAQIAQRVVGQLSEKVIREVAWEVIPDLAEALIKKEIERIKADINEP